jgi:hypothetical protein
MWRCREWLDRRIPPLEPVGVRVIGWADDPESGWTRYSIVAPSSLKTMEVWMVAPRADCPNRAEAGASRLITALSASSKMISTRDVEGNEIGVGVEPTAARRWAAFGNSAAFMTLTSSFGKRAQIGKNGT